MRIRSWCFSSMVVASVLWALPAHAQMVRRVPPTNAQPQQDPLAALMVAQPPIDTTQPLVAQAEFDPPVITLGQSAIYRVTLNAMQVSVDWPETNALTEAFNAKRGASGQILRSTGTNIVPTTSFLYHVSPDATGSFVCPPFTIHARGQELTIPSTTLSVLPANAAIIPPARRLRLVAPSTTCYVGEELRLEVACDAEPGGPVRALSQVEINGDSVIVDRNFIAQRMETVMRDGRPVPTFVASLYLTPMRPGKIPLTAQAFAMSSMPPGRVVISGHVVIRSMPPAYTLMDSEPLELNVRPLPDVPDSAGFTGAIGQFSLDPPQLSTNQVQAGDLVMLTVTLRGNGNLTHVTPPPWPDSTHWQAYPPSENNPMPAIVRQRGFVVFQYKLIPLDDSIESTPPIPFCYFDPAKRAYVDLTVPPVSLNVAPAPGRKSLAGNTVVTKAREKLQTLVQHDEKPMRLAALLGTPGRTATHLAPVDQRTWFLLIQLVPAALLAGVWLWDVRRRFLEAHPDYVLRQQARRAGRHHLQRARRAATHRDAHQFVRHAVEAFRALCAPSAPADPKALVYADVVEAMPLEQRQGEAAVLARKLFDAENNWRFDQRPPDDADALAMAPQVNRTLKEMRDRL